MRSQQAINLSKQFPEFIRISFCFQLGTQFAPSARLLIIEVRHGQLGSSTRAFHVLPTV